MIAPLQSFDRRVPGELRCELIDPLSGCEWDSLVQCHPDHTVFHRAAWARVLAETYGHRPYYLHFLVDGADSALLPLMEVRSPMTGVRGISLPFSDFAGPLWNSEGSQALVSKFLISFAVEHNWHHLEIRGGFQLEDDHSGFRQYCSHQLDLRPGLRQLEAGLPRSTIRSIHKAEHSGLEIRISRESDDLARFYHLHMLTRRRHGLPPQPYGFFEAVGRHLIEAGLGIVVLAFHGRTAVAGAVFLTSGDRALFKYGASDKDYWPLRPNHRVMWSAIEHLAASGFRRLDFGRTSAHDAGLIRFKQSWGTTEERLVYHRYDLRRQAWMSRSGRTPQGMPGFFSHLPLALNRFAGRLVYPHLD